MISSTEVYITETGVRKEITIENLTSYTKAAHPNDIYMVTDQQGIKLYSVFNGLLNDLNDNQNHAVSNGYITVSQGRKSYAASNGFVTGSYDTTDHPNNSISTCIYATTDTQPLTEQSLPEKETKHNSEIPHCNGFHDVRF